MTREELIKDLKSLARQSDDAALAEELVVATFRPMFNALMAPDNPDMDRVHEVKFNAIDRVAHARKFRMEGDIFRATVAMLEAGS